ncbi:MAG: hypothetical protein AMXMBFR64_56740 [Myxococcales bacterium]
MTLSTRDEIRLGPEEREALVATLKKRFDANMRRHRDLEWKTVQGRLDLRPEKLWPIAEMERTGGEPDVIARDAETGEVVFCDCAAESPAGRRSVCYDEAALESRKQHKPWASALGLAEAMGVELLDEAGYRALQALGTFDAKTSSWIRTPSPIRALGGALFGDHRFGQVFIYHNGAESYYAARGFRGSLRV